MVAKEHLDKEEFFCLALVLGISLRYLAMTRGHNFDFESYKIVGELVAGGHNVYANTSRYNYGPLFLWIQGLCFKIGAHTSEGDWLFRALIVTVLTWGDVGIALFLKKHFGNLPAALFFLSPISIIITGYHNQFDNLAILLMLYAVGAVERYDGKKRDALFIVFFTLSLMMKHIFAFFIIWIAFSKRLSNRQKFLYAVIPVGCVCLSFLLYCGFDRAAWQGVFDNVLRYRSFNNAPLLKPIYDLIGLAPEAYIFVFAGAMIAFGLVFRKCKMVEGALLYTMCMVSLSSAVANQYLAIPLAALAVFNLPLSLLYDAFGFVYLLGSSEGLQVSLVQTVLPSVVNEREKWYFVECAILAIAIVWMIVRMIKAHGKDDWQGQKDASEKATPHPREPSMRSNDWQHLSRCRAGGHRSVCTLGRRIFSYFEISASDPPSMR